MASLEQARAHFEVGEFAKARTVAVDGLGGASEDVELLRIAGRAGVETGADDAVEQLTKVTELQPDSAEAWRDLGDALAAEGRTEEANAAFRKVLEIDSDDELALTALGHTAFQTGDKNDAVSMLEQVADRGTGVTTAAISLVEMYRALGQSEEALAAARRIAAADPDEPLYALDVAELSLDAGHADDAAEAFSRLRELVDLPEDEVGVLQGLVKTELARDRPQEALGLARQASAIDTVGRSTGVLAHLEADLGVDSTPEDAVARGQSTAFLQAIQAPPSRQEAQELIDATLADLRRSLSGEGRG
jgi:Flp pilus assembly protein TadD